MFIDSLSSLVALKKKPQKKPTNHPYIANVLEIYNKLMKLEKSVVLLWIISHVGIKGHESVELFRMQISQRKLMTS